MAGLDLSGVRTVIEDWLADTLHVYAENGSSDDILDEETGDLTPAEPAELYSGDGSILPALSSSEVADVDTQTVPVDSEITHKMLLPLASPSDIRPGNMVTVSAVNPTSGDAALIGKWFEVVETPTISSFSVLRLVWMKPARAPGWAT